MKFQKPTSISLRNHPEFNERWLQERIAEDPSLLGLGDLEIKDIERRQPRAGRLDLLLVDPETRTRYEVEIQLGATDETHIIRTIEYWDIEKTRYPQYEHVAVLVAEDVTTRFLNVVSLFNKAIPLIAIEIRALEVGDLLTLHATKVLDLMPLGTDEDDEAGQATDRAYWVARGSEKSVGLAEKIAAILNELDDSKRVLKFNKHYIGLANGAAVDNIVTFRPRRDTILAEFRIERSEAVSELVEEAEVTSLPYDRWGRYRIRLTEKDIKAQAPLITQLLRLSLGLPVTADLDTSG